MKKPWLLPFGLLLPLLPRGLCAQFQYTANNGMITLTNYAGSGGAVTISNFVTSIGSEAFYDSYSIPSVTIPSSVTTLDTRRLRIASA